MSSAKSDTGTTTEKLTQTVRCRAETSDRKNETIEAAVEDYQTMAHHLGVMMPSIPPSERTHTNGTLYRMARRKSETVKATVATQAVRQATETFRSWQERGCPGDRPTLGDGSFIRISGRDYDIVPNDRGYGLKARIIPREVEWFHLDTGEFQEDRLARVVDDDPVSAGRAEFRLDGDDLWFHFSISEEVEVYEPGDVDTRVGVDLGELVIFAAAVVDDKGVQAVEMELGGRFRHHRERLSAKRDRLARQGDLSGVRECRGERARYTEHVTHSASRQIVDLAAEHAPCVIHLEDLDGYRERAKDPIHDWPQGMIREQVEYKARNAGIPVQTVDPSGTSQECRHCGRDGRAERDGAEFRCERCDYEVHSDVNAAINIANKRE